MDPITIAIALGALSLGYLLVRSSRHQAEVPVTNATVSTGEVDAVEYFWRPG